MFGQDDPVPPPHPNFSHRISAIHMTRPDWVGARAPRGYATATYLSFFSDSCQPNISISTGPIDIRQISWVGRTVATDDQFETSF